MSKRTRREPSAPGAREVARVFQLGQYWLDRERGSAVWSYYWYDEQARRTRRKTTGCRELEDAKTWLAKLVLAAPPDEPMDEHNVTIAAVRRHYFKHHADKIRSRNAARRALGLLSEYAASYVVEGAPKVADFSLARQHGYMRWCRDKHNLSNKSISTYLSYIKAALRFAATPILVTDHHGVEREVRLLKALPFVEDSEEKVAKVTGLPRSRPRDWIPTDAELARIIDAIEHEHVFRYVVIALNTWARPEAITELDVARQVNFERGLVDLNPPGRSQNKKVRPMVRLTANLRGWLLHWNASRPISINNSPVGRIDNRTLARAAGRAEVKGEFVKYTLRHYMATRVRRVAGVSVSREERATWMGHVDPHHRTTEAHYESMDPDYLLNAANATDAILELLDRHCRVRRLVPPNATRSGLTVVSGSSETEALTG